MNQIDFSVTISFQEKRVPYSLIDFEKYRNELRLCDDSSIFPLFSVARPGKWNTGCMVFACCKLSMRAASLKRHSRRVLEWHFRKIPSAFFVSAGRSLGELIARLDSPGLFSRVSPCRHRGHIQLSMHSGTMTSGFASMYL